MDAAPSPGSRVLARLATAAYASLDSVGAGRTVAGPTAERGDSPLTHVEEFAAREGRTAEWPEWVPARLREAWVDRGVAVPWAHQVLAAELAWTGRSVVVSTGTASGKSLAYQLPILSTLLTDERATALYLSPTKALSNDQLRAIHPLVADAGGVGGAGGIRPAAYDGDTPSEERDWVRAHARWVFTNPDMLHRGILPAHGRWRTFLRSLRYVVVDECHGYRGVFGSHVAHVLRRLRRLCALYGADPTFVLASATVSDPAGSASRLTGLDCAAVTEDTSPRGAATFALWEPPLSAVGGENGAPLRRPATTEAARLLADLVIEEARTLVFVRSRRAAESVALQAQRHLVEAGAGDLAGRVAAYRGGYLPEERRALERALASGKLLGAATTTALELGVDISGLDAVVLAGFPGTLASLWQQAGRAGREGQGALAVLIARDDPLDTYLVHHPSAVFGRPVEATVTDPWNPYVFAPQLCCAAAERPIDDSELPDLGGEVARRMLDRLVDEGFLRRRATGWFWTTRDRPNADIRGSGEGQVAVVEDGTGRLLGTVDPGAAHSTVHAGAVYLHRGESYVVDHLDLEAGTALVHAEDPDWTTVARDRTDIAVVEETRVRKAGGASLVLGTVDVTNQVVSFQRRRAGSGEIIDETPLGLPERQLRTQAVWWTADENLLAGADVDAPTAPGALHAAEHAAIGLLPLFATCDRWDIGGVSTAVHEDTGLATVFVYDGHQGGAGFAERGFARATEWLAATRAAVAACECETGCPSCVQSPKCGNGNDPLDKAAAVRLLDGVLAALKPEDRTDPS